MRSRPSVTGDDINYSQKSPKRREETEREEKHYTFFEEMTSEHFTHSVKNLQSQEVQQPER